MTVKLCDSMAVILCGCVAVSVSVAAKLWLLNCSCCTVSMCLCLQTILTTVVADRVGLQLEPREQVLAIQSCSMFHNVLVLSSKCMLASSWWWESYSSSLLL